MTQLLACGSGSGSGGTKPEPIVNQAPVASDDAANLFKDQQIDIDVLANDTDADKDELSITAVTAIKGGTPSINNNKVLFIAEPGFTGAAQFSYTISDGSKTANASVNITISLSPADKMTELKAQVDSFIADTIANINEQAIDCVTYPEQPQCELVLVKFSDGQFDATKMDPMQTILILDEGFEFSATVRYRSRVKAAFTQLDSGFYQQAEQGSYDPQYNLPKIIKETLQQIDQFSDKDNKKVFIPAAWLAQLKPDIERLYPAQDNYTQYLDHGKMPFLYLLEHNPKAELVIAPIPDFYKQKTELFCQPEIIEMDQTESNLVRLRQYIATIADKFKADIINDQSIDYINYSAGHTLNTVKSRWTKYCKKDLPNEETLQALLGALRPFYEILMNSDNVFSLQSSQINMTMTNNALDIDKSYHNRLLIGDFTTLDSKLTLNGIVENEAPPELYANRDNSKQWIDLFINFGIIETRPFPFNDTPVMNTHPLGLNYLPISNMQPSWATPVALSWAINIKNTHFVDEPLDNNIIEQIKAKMTPELCSYSNWDIADYYGKCKMQDPLLHRQHEVYRLGYLE
ncbi:Ig-like domain-containing protein [Pseudoalteromonas denitrificans]|nr:Ig-like domain-containing protein [Pseudoalteromonas denitrificans]